MLINAGMAVTSIKTHKCFPDQSQYPCQFVNGTLIIGLESQVKSIWTEIYFYFSGWNYRVVHGV